MYIYIHVSAYMSNLGPNQPRTTQIIFFFAAFQCCSPHWYQPYSACTIMAMDSGSPSTGPSSGTRRGHIIQCRPLLLKQQLSPKNVIYVIRIS